MLDEVMDKEVYKVAKEILEKFAPEQLRKDLPVSTMYNSDLRVFLHKESIGLSGVKMFTQRKMNISVLNYTLSRF